MCAFYECISEFMFYIKPLAILVTEQITDEMIKISDSGLHETSSMLNFYRS